MIYVYVRAFGLTIQEPPMTRHVTLQDALTRCERLERLIFPEQEIIVCDNGKKSQYVDGKLVHLELNLVEMAKELE